MSISTIGDMRQFFMTARHNTAIKSELNTLVQELSSGRVADVTSHLGGGQANLSGLDRQIEMLQSFSRSGIEIGQQLATVQTALSNVDGYRAQASGALLTINEASTPSQVSDAAAISRSSFEAAIQSLNLRHGDRAIFGGNDVDSSPLVDATTMLDAIRLDLVGLTDAADISAAIDTWFDAPAGGFDTIGYQGDATGFQSRSVSAAESVEIAVRADDPAIRDTLKHLAKGALAGEPSIVLDAGARRDLQTQSGVNLLAMAAPMAALGARIGFAERQVEETAVRNSAAATTFSIARNDLVAADPFETATQLQFVQTQLETHYTLTARLSRLSLTEYLR